ncbi:MAG: NAD-dependent epimerase/dehydratase family protein [Acidobacteria bacterium]|nr:NAD-dependent epimerase/dehydratase family protein [Acidobacteriota bacterium]
MSLILVTGATGFLGKHLVERLKQAEPDLRLRLLCRGPSLWDQDPGVEVVRGDITSPTDVSKAMEGVTAVYHLAGVVLRNPRDPGLLYRVHVEGTRNVCEAARLHRPERIVVVSSSGTIAVGREPVAYDESSGYKNDIVGEWPYYLSKIFAEKLAYSYVRLWHLPIVVVNPSLLLGPGDDRSSSTGDIALFLEGQIMAFPLGGLNFVDARDAAAGLIAAMRSGEVGERYLFGGPNWTFRELIEAVAKISGRRPPQKQLSLRSSLLGTRLLRGLYPLAGKSYRLDEVSIKMSALFWYCNSEKARCRLGFQTRDPMETLQDTVKDVRRRMGRL